MSNRYGKAAILAGFVALATASVGQAAKPEKTPPVPPTVAKLTDCRKLTDDTQRLACFDREVAALEGEIRSNDVAIVNRADVRKTRRSLFGIPLPDIKLFANDDEPEVKEITAVIRSVGRNGDGQVVFTLEDGAVWAQTDQFPVYGAVKSGQKVTLKRAAFGSYFAKFEKTVSVRAKRIR